MKDYTREKPWTAQDFVTQANKLLLKPVLLSPQKQLGLSPYALELGETMGVGSSQ